MECRACGTTIADQAIVCFRCGESTALPSAAPAVTRPAGPSGAWRSAAIAAAVAGCGVWADLTWIDDTWTRAAVGVGAVGVPAGVLLWLRTRRAARSSLRVD